MSKLNIRQIQDRGKEIMSASRAGIRWTELINQIARQHPETPKNTINGALYALMADSKKITRLSRGIYALRSDEEVTPPQSDPDKLLNEQVKVETASGEITITEESFYAPFAEWLKSSGEVIEATPLGGNFLRGKWGTPDVLGVLKPQNTDAIKFELEIVSAEVKIDPNQPIVAFGQAMAYRLFSHKSYMVMPNNILPDDLDRLEALSGIYGLGLVTFSLDPKEPKFFAHIKAQAVRPDVFYMNQMAKRIRETNADLFNKLF